MAIAITVAIIATRDTALPVVYTEGRIGKTSGIIGGVTGNAGLIDTLAGAWVTTVEVFGTSNTVKAIAHGHTDRRIAPTALVAPEDTADTIPTGTLTGIGIITIVIIETRDTALAVLTKWCIPTASSAIYGVAGLTGTAHTLGGLAATISIAKACHTDIALSPFDTKRRLAPTPGMIGCITGHTGLIDTLVAIAIAVITTLETAIAARCTEGALGTAIMGGLITELAGIAHTLAGIGLTTIIIAETLNTAELTGPVQAERSRTATALVRADFAELAGVLDTLLAATISVGYALNALGIIKAVGRVLIAAGIVI